MSDKQAYTDKDRAAGLAALEANGGNVAKTARQLGVPRKTLQYWQMQYAAPPKPKPEEIKEAKVAKVAEELGQQKRSLANQFREFVGNVLRLTTDEDIKESSLRDRFTAAGIAIDKRELLLGRTVDGGGARTPSVIILEVQPPLPSAVVIPASPPPASSMPSIQIEAPCPT